MPRLNPAPHFHLPWIRLIMLSVPPALQAMAFKNEVVSDDNIDRYNLPFKKGEGRWWTRDAERDFFLWGGLAGNPAYDDMREGRFHFYVDGFTYWVKLLVGEGSQSLQDSPFIIKWNSIARIEPEISDREKRSIFIDILKQALLAYGYEGQDDGWVEHITVLFGF